MLVVCHGCKAALCWVLFWIRNDWLKPCTVIWIVVLSSLWKTRHGPKTLQKNGRFIVHAVAVIKFQTLNICTRQKYRSLNFFPFFLHFLQKSHHVMCVWYNICFAMLTSKLVPVAHCSSSAFPKLFKMVKYIIFHCLELQLWFIPLTELLLFVSFSLALPSVY